jgi:hypothetical protein
MKIGVYSMRIDITTIRGLAFNLLIEEAHDRDQQGGTLCYFADIYRQDKASGSKRLIRRSRLPETAAAIRRDVERDGIQALRQFAT